MDLTKRHRVWVWRISRFCWYGNSLVIPTCFFPWIWGMGIEVQSPRQPWVFYFETSPPLFSLSFGFQTSRGSSDAAWTDDISQRYHNRHHHHHHHHHQHQQQQQLGGSEMGHADTVELRRLDTSLVTKPPRAAMLDLPSGPHTTSGDQPTGTCPSSPHERRTRPPDVDRAIQQRRSVGDPDAEALSPSSWLSDCNPASLPSHYQTPRTHHHHRHLRHQQQQGQVAEAAVIASHHPLLAVPPSVSSFSRPPTVDHLQLHALVAGRHYALHPQCEFSQSILVIYVLELLLLPLYPFNGLFSRTSWVSRYQKERQETMGFWDGSGISWTTWKQSFQTDNHTNTLYA